MVVAVVKQSRTLVQTVTVLLLVEAVVLALVVQLVSLAVW